MSPYNRNVTSQKFLSITRDFSASTVLSHGSINAAASPAASRLRSAGSAYLCTGGRIVRGDTPEDYITGVKPNEVGFTVNDGSAVDFVVLKDATGLGVGLDLGRDTERYIEQQQRRLDTVRNAPWVNNPIRFSLRGISWRSNL